MSSSPSKPKKAKQVICIHISALHTWYSLYDYPPVRPQINSFSLRVPIHHIKPHRTRQKKRTYDHVQYRPFPFVSFIPCLTPYSLLVVARHLIPPPKGRNWNYHHSREPPSYRENNMAPATKTPMIIPGIAPVVPPTAPFPGAGEDAVPPPPVPVGVVPPVPVPFPVETGPGLVTL